jgi:hypothetical protein
MNQLSDLVDIEDKIGKINKEIRELQVLVNRMIKQIIQDSKNDETKL